MSVITLDPVLTSEEAGVPVYEAVVTVGQIIALQKEGHLKITNVRPDHDITGYDENGSPVYARTSDTAKKWTRELLNDDAILGNLAWNIDPDRVHFSVEDNKLTVNEVEGGAEIDTSIDSATRHRAIVDAGKNDYARTDRKVSVRIYTLPKRENRPDLDVNAICVEKVFSRMQNWGHSVTQSTTKWYAQENWYDRVARMLVEGTEHLRDNVVLKSNYVLAASYELTSFNTISEAIKQSWREAPKTQAEEREIADYLIRFYNRAAEVRPELGVMNASKRKASRETNWMSRQMIMYGLMAVAYRIYREGSLTASALMVLDKLDTKISLQTVGLRHQLGAVVDYFDFDNPIFEERGMVSLRTRQSGGNKYLKPHGDSMARLHMREIVLELCGFVA